MLRLMDSFYTRKGGAVKYIIPQYFVCAAGTDGIVSRKQPNAAKAVIVRNLERRVGKMKYQVRVNGEEVATFECGSITTLVVELVRDQASMAAATVQAAAPGDGQTQGGDKPEAPTSQTS